MLVMPSTAVNVSQPLTKRFCTVCRYDNGSFVDKMSVNRCSAILEKLKLKFIMNDMRKENIIHNKLFYFT